MRNDNTVKSGVNQAMLNWTRGRFSKHALKI